MVWVVFELGILLEGLVVVLVKGVLLEMSALEVIQFVCTVCPKEKGYFLLIDSQL